MPSITAPTIDDLIEVLEGFKEEISGDIGWCVKDNKIYVEGSDWTISNYLECLDKVLNDQHHL